MPRLLFEKKGNAVWISHLDLMRLFQRAFKRAHLPLKHTQGFNPRPSVSIALPLSVGIESGCELLDFEIVGETVPNDEICDRLNHTLINGIKVLNVYDDGRKIRDLALLKCVISMEYDSGISAQTMTAIEALFRRESLPVEKKNKNGVLEQNIIPMIRRMNLTKADSRVLEINALICCQNPTLNPMQFVSAVERYLPECAPDFAKFRRIEIYDQNETVFR